jgi:hypothetical protein
MISPKHINSCWVEVNPVVTSGDYKGHTPLDLAKNDEIRELLIKRGGKKGSEL